ncbi:unnamed protein product [Cyprideis torosa]|uniref:Histone-lysine N-methyltransferase n=1 Tax=Cyprideis torosa TaxID=163714 RepID=A0A7R8WP36_9CRUS|nr:unnamed protein product [Cyprideis torosa]CAG0906599.1 unnamed protein product [Cyprideis torosa]
MRKDNGVELPPGSAEWSNGVAKAKKDTITAITTRCKQAARAPYKGRGPAKTKQHFLNEAVVSEIHRHQEDLSRWKEELSSLCVQAGEAEIGVENRVDFAAAPKDFTFITSCIPGPGVMIPSDPVISCECIECGSNDSTCCPGLGVLGDPVSFPYLPDGRLKEISTAPLYECNSKCLCGPQCPNRVVQKGRQVPLTIFRTRDKGWGVKTNATIYAKQFVTEYVGEIVTEEEAERRGKLYDSQGTTYLFDLDYAMDNVHVIDAAKFGNISHFMNHSCSPNLGVRIAYVNCMDVSIPRVAFFALRHIRQGEELTFDYNPPRQQEGAENPKSDPADQRPPVPCRCGSSNCRRLLPL